MPTDPKPPANPEATLEAKLESLPKTPDPDPTRHQYIELAPLLPHVTEFRRHEVCCPSCGHRTRAHYDDDVIPRYAFGPRVAAVATLLTGVYHLSRRSTVRLLQELLGLRISTGSVSNLERRMSVAVEPAVDEAWAEAQSAAVKHVDGTTWLQVGVILALWTIATAGVTVFKILDNGQGETLERELLTSTKGVLVSDRASALKFWAMHLRQICWAHLLRKFVSFTERDGPTRTLGRELLDCTRVVFAYWYDFKEGRLTREQFAARIAPVRMDFERTLRRAIDAGIKTVRVAVHCTEADCGQQPVEWAKEQGLKWSALIGHGAGYGQFDKLFATFKEDANYIYNVDPVAAQLLNPASLAPGMGDVTKEMVRRYKADVKVDEVPPHVSMGFNQAWIFLTDVLPRAIKKHGGTDAEALRKAALETDIKVGGTIQGYGVKFNPPGHAMSGQNALSSPVVMQYSNQDTFIVWPTAIKTKDPILPLPKGHGYSAQ